MAELKKDTIRIRMYRVGFGDCFLISLPVDSRHAHLLVDCGVHFKGNIGTISDAVTDALAESKGELAIVIATHAHQDHISGFGACEKQFRASHVKEVWMPWTEDAEDETAARLKKKSLALVDQLRLHFAAKPPSEAALAALFNLTGNEKALQLLHSGINNGRVRYLEAGTELKDPAAIPGLSVRVLGPPRDEAFLATMDPPKGERFLRMKGGRAADLNCVKPFGKRWILHDAQRNGYPTLTKADRKALEDLAGDPESLAFVLDEVMNNTSVVTLLSYRGQHLLLAGDAQYGNWDFWLKKQGSQDLLAGVNFYKVGHHGSFNATPKKALEQMTRKGFAAMASTQNTPWSSIPLDKLVVALEEKSSGFVRSDSIPVKGAPQGPVLKKLPRGFSRGKLWFDYEIRCPA